MRSSTFIILSLIIHIIAVAAVTLSPHQTIEPSGGEIEMTTGAPDEAAGIPTAAPTVTTTEPAPAPVQAAPAPKVEKVKPAVAAVVPVKKSTPKKAAVVAAKTPVAETTEEVAELPAKEEVASEPVQDEQLSPVVEDIKEDTPADVQGDTKTEAAAVEANPPSPEPAPETGAKNTSADGAGEGDLGKGGATPAAAVAYTELKQDKGNKNPSYPLKARKEERQGQVDLVYRVTKDGHVADVQIAKSSGHADLDQAAVKSVSKFKFIPSQEGWAYHPVIFALKGDRAPLPSKLRTAGSEGAE